MTKRIQPLFGVLATAALAALPAAAAGSQQGAGPQQGAGSQQGGAGQQPQDAQQKGGAQQQQDAQQKGGAQQQQGTQHPGEKGAQPGTLNAPVRVNESVTFPVENGCHYHADAKGAVVPIKSATGAKAGGSTTGTEQPDQGQKLNANVSVVATLSCPNAVEQKVTESFTKAGMTRQELLDGLALHSSIVSTANGQHCLYVPEFDFTDDNKLTAKGIAYMCPVHGQGDGAPKGGGAP